MPPFAPTSPDDRKPFSGFLLIIGLIVLAAGAKPILYDTLDPDCFWHLRVGEQLTRDGIGPLRDSLSFSSMTERWTPYSWLAELGMAKLWAIGGFRAAILSTSLLVAGIMGLIALACRESIHGSLDDGAADAIVQGRKWLATALATGFAVFLSLPYLSFRPVTAEIFLLALCLWLILRDRRLAERSRAVWLTPLIAAVAVNLHLFAVLLPIWFAALLAGAAWERVRLFDPCDRAECNRCVRRYAALCAASAIGCLMTPMLPGTITAIGHYSLRDPMVASKIIGEMQPFWRGGMGKVSLVLVIAFAIRLVLRHRRLRVGELLLVAGHSVLLLWLGRFAPLFALVAAPAFAVTLPGLSDRVLGKPLLRGAMAMVLMLGLLRAITEFPSRDADLSAWLNRHGPDAPGYPVEAVRFVAANVGRGNGRLINEFNWGGYLEWSLGDRYQVLLDGRTQVFAAEFWNEVYLGSDESCRRFMSKVRADAAVLPAENSRFKATLVSLGWRTVHADERAEVLVPPGDLAGVDRE